ncbi:hypothetical protein [Roseococcus sp. YIM B11640]|uniref:hypothetical protein n=1 Tax=Roseococcus sp. YIM B11640 TaxID=3133973 RepID=UPI003C7A5041
MRLFHLGLLAGLVAVTPALAQQRPDAVAVTRSGSEQATIESIDQRARQVVLRMADGTLKTIQVGPEVRNLPQAKAGDIVVVEYGEGLALELANPADGAPPVDGGAAAAAAPLGSRPGVGFAQAVRARVTINEVNSRTGTVTFTGPNGVQRTVRPQRPEVVRFARQLRPGQQVDVVYAERLAIRVQPAR